MSEGNSGEDLDTSMELEEQLKRSGVIRTEPTDEKYPARRSISTEDNQDHRSAHGGHDHPTRASPSTTPTLVSEVTGELVGNANPQTIFLSFPPFSTATTRRTEVGGDPSDNNMSNEVHNQPPQYSESGIEYPPNEPKRSGLEQRQVPQMEFRPLPKRPSQSGEERGPIPHERLLPYVREMNDPSAEKRFVCSICDQKFKKRYYVTQHLRSHFDDKPFGCEYCGQRFNHRSNLTAHEQGHTGEYKFFCRFCHKGYSRRDRVEKHERKHH
mmetsp:Transcript_6590/g.16058  ORF Transcript_6590/g.16058 Transcript_6590/m.16058 type:complete len:269 (+) Transcript_6590:175-981(+)